MSAASILENSHNVVIHGSTFNVASGNMSIAAVDDNRRKIFEWLNSPDPSPNYNIARETYCRGTGMWFLSGEEYYEWKVHAGVPILVYGLPGSGKTVLCSTIIEDIKNHCKNSGPMSTYAYFMFDGRNAQDDFQLHHKFIRSLIWQFSSGLDTVPSPLLGLYGNGHMQPSLNDLESTLREILQLFTNTFILIDSLDECVEWRYLSTWIKDVTEHSAKQLHLLATSRPLIDIQEDMTQIDHISIDMDKAIISQDISLYIDKMLISSRRLRSLESKEIKRILLECADGMFRLVAFRLQELELCRNMKELQECMNDLPKNLDAMYSQMLSKINPDDCSLALFILQWLSFAARTLKLKEIAEAVAVDFGKNNKPSFDPNCRFFDPQEILAICRGLIIQSDDEVRLSHFSVKEYLTSTRREVKTDVFYINESLSHSIITQTCLAYLLHCTKKMQRSGTHVTNDFYLAEYSAEFWFWHSKAATEINNENEHQLMTELLSNHTAYTEMLGLYNPNPSKDIIPSFIYASQLGLVTAVVELLKKGADPTIQGGYYGNALQAASVEGHSDIVQLLLEKGVDPNIQGGFYGNALQAASFERCRDIILLLLEKGAYLNIQGGYYENALHAASFGGHKDIVKLLLEKGADPNIQGGYWGSALQVASVEGHKDIILLLLKKGADPNTQRGYYGNALQAALVEGHRDIVQLLLEKGADPNIQGGYWGYALEAASMKGHRDIVKLLLEKGADPNIHGEINKNSLNTASAKGYSDIVQLLLEKGADPNIQGGYYGNSLNTASVEGHRDIVQLLLEKGADPNIQFGGLYGNALQSASVEGHRDIVQLLLEKGADPNIQGGIYENALQAASVGGHRDIVKLLLEKDADPNTQGGIYGNSLQAASVEGHRDIVSS